MKDYKEKIGELVGEASMCWSNIEGAGTFDSDKAKIIVEKIEQIISERDKELKEEGNYQCVDCGNWNVKSPLTQCSECRRQD